MHTLGTPPSTGTNVLVLDPKAKNQPVATAAGPSVRTIARQNDIDLGKLLSILSHRRPEGSQTEEDFVVEFLDSIEGMQKDGFGNRYIRVGTAPVMWSCHTDTVSDEGGMQNIKWQGDILALNEPKRGQSLGADDGAGMWLLLEMLKAGREGLYIFHREEEVGGVGSRWIAKNNPELIDGITMAIAFDRKDTSSVITRQRGRRCCSDKFGEALADALNKTEGMKYELDPTGVFTDTASYTELIAECTNISVGYYNEHSDRETLDVAHLLRLREALLTLDVSTLPIERDPSVKEFGHNYSRGWSSSNWGKQPQKSYDPLDRMAETIKTRSYSVAKMLQGMGITPYMLDQMIQNVWRNEKQVDDKEWQGQLAEYFRKNEHMVDGPVEEEEAEEENVFESRLWCNDCQDFDLTNTSLGEAADGDFCGHCYRNDTELLEVEVDALTGDVVE